ncbi:acetyl-CoA synthetase-like protein [Conidiobolus coronatus NRRL 28638]|uniref:Acetyl-CoA synthetase-like protein n=1 Tax=Conidiobolus coronatus (strain ATCC 28846 / CBS 209.66 / NRRL 28638) TaxID=796925 RepID=A0A137NTC1_CONC2|nr:acetyl-CoA synthetase-like protein [Conidiobolus coronatus NRRL 28638]|eukprot:KXN65972.1 acetyl-CoA synthetase-like protein [Conidiobolus coronatus NRRL 28638]
MDKVKFSTTGRFIDLISENANSDKYANSTAISISPRDKYIDLTFQQLDYVVSHSAKFFYKNLNHADFSKVRNVGLLSNSDSNYIFNFLGLIKVNVAPLSLSPRNSLEATVHLLKESNSQVLIYQGCFKDFAYEIKKLIPNILLVPTWIANISESNYLEEYSLLVPLMTKEEELNNVSYILHSSGSTSYPKLVSHKNLSTHNSAHRYSLELTDPSRKQLFFFPLFHGAGIFNFILAPMYEKRSVILCPDISPGSRVSSKMIIQLIQQQSLTDIWLLPVIVKELIDYCESSPKSEGWDILEKIERINYAGAQLPRSMIINIFDHGITPWSIFGLSEACMILKCYPDRNSEYLVPLTPVEGLTYKLKDWGDNIGELVILGDDPCLADVKDLDEEGNYSTKDLFEIVGQNPLRLNYVSRADDTIVHVNGEKSNPLPMEDKINSLQLNKEEVSKAPLQDVISTIKSYVSEANLYAPSHSRIYDEMIYYIPMDSEKKLPVTMKGNLMRKKCYQLFEEEVKLTVENMESGYASDDGAGTQSSSSSEMQKISSVVEYCLKSILDRPLVNGDSFFTNGMDSLSGMRFRNLLKSKIPGLDLKVTDIYDNDTIEKLVEFIEFSKQGKKPNIKSLEDYQKEVDDYIARYTNLGLEKSCTKQLPTEDFHVAITGANGSLGSFMIKNLVEQSKVTKIYALIRAKDDAQAKQKLESSFSQRFIDINPENSAKIVPLAVKLHEDQLGLSKDTYESILPKLTHVHHVGWTMNFLKGLDYFDDCIAASKNLMKLCVLSQHKAIYNLVSTIGATFPTTSADVASVPESSLSTKLLNAGTCNGYNLSKLVTETVSQIWSVDYDIPVHIHRVGQVSGDTINGAWNTTEHIPLFVKGIKLMKIFPDILESSVTWIPANTAADAIVEIGAQDQNSQNRIAHIINPLEYNWKIIYNALKSYGIEFEVVPVQEFIHQLKTNPEFQNADINPLATLTDFFDYIFLRDQGVILETQLTKKCSLSIANCPALDFDLMMKYLKFWKSHKLFE